MNSLVTISTGMGLKQVAGLQLSIVLMQHFGVLKMAFKERMVYMNFKEAYTVRTKTFGI